MKEEATLASAIFSSWHSIHFRHYHSLSKKINLNTPRLASELSLTPNQSGAIALLQDDGSYVVTKFSQAEIRIPEITLDDLWTCTKEHFGWTAATAALTYGGMPIKKMKLGHGTHFGSSSYTNRISSYGTKYFPRAVLKSGTTAAKLAKATLGTTRIFGIIGRTTPFAAIGFAVFDLVSIGMCILEEKNGH